MRALMSQQPGGPETLELLELPIPASEPGQILIEVKACGVNFPDVLTIEDRYQVKTSRPFAPGAEVAGIVSELGSGVTGFEIGQRITARTGTGGMAEYMLAAADRCNPLADGISFRDAAVMQFTFETAYYALVTRAKVRAGETVLVLGAAGGVGSAAIQIARNLGARVIAAVSSSEKADFARLHGASDALVYPREAPKDRRALGASFKEMLRERGADVVVDPVGGWLSETAMRCTADGGRFLVLGFTAGISALPLNLPLLKNGDVLGINWRTFVMQQSAENESNRRVLAQWYREGKLSAGITAEFSLSEGAKALRLVADREAIGKVVVTMP